MNRLRTKDRREVILVEKKMDNKLMIRIAAIVIIIAAVGFAVWKIIDNVTTAKAKADYVQKQQDTVVLVLDPIARAHGINDLNCTYADFDNGYNAVQATLVSADFEALDNETKLLFLSEAIMYCDMIPYDSGNRLVSTIVTNGIDIEVEGTSGTYRETCHKGLSELCLNEEILCTLETEHSVAVKAEEDAREQSKNNKNKGCKRCGEEGVTLTGGGYCKRCVDIYYTDYYINLDGQISADRPY